jgi:hypothetical protein
MADTKVDSTGGSWEPSTTIELLALLLTIPGALAAIATLWVILVRRRQKKFRMVAHAYNLDVVC